MTRRWLRKRGSRLDRLSPDDVEVVRQCLTAALRGPFFDGEEFHTLFGLERSEVENVLRGWPDPENPKDQDLAVTNILNWLLGYPHGQSAAVWHEFITVPPREVASVLARWLGEDELDTSGRGYFERMR